MGDLFGAALVVFSNAHSNPIISHRAAELQYLCGAITTNQFFFQVKRFFFAFDGANLHTPAARDTELISESSRYLA